MKNRVSLALLAISVVAISLIYLLALEQISVRGQAPEGDPRPDFSPSFKQATSKAEYGGRITYTIVISNSGDVAASDTELRDGIPLGTKYVTESVKCNYGGCWYSSNDDTVVWKDTLDAHGWTTVSYAVDVESVECGTTLTNTATISAPAALASTIIQAYTQMVGNVYELCDMEGHNCNFGPTADWANSDWQQGISSSYGPGWGHSGRKYWGTNITDGDYRPNMYSVLSKTLTVPNDPNGVYLQWWEWYDIEEPNPVTGAIFDIGKFLINETEVYTHVGSSTGWEHQQVDLTPYAGSPITVTFVLSSDGSVQKAGWYIDDFAIHGGCPKRPEYATSMKQATPKATEGGLITYTLLVRNSGDDMAWNTTLHDAIPQGTEYVPDSVDCEWGTCSYSSTEDAILWSAQMPNGGWTPISYTVQLKGPLCGDIITNTATISDPEAAAETIVQGYTQIVGAVYELCNLDEGSPCDFVTAPSDVSDWRWSYFTYGPDWAHSGQYGWATIADGKYDDNRTSVLSKTLTVPTDPNGVYLQWWEWYETEENLDEGFVYVNGELKHYVNGVSNGWQQAMVNVSDHAGKEITVNWVFVSDDSVNYAGWYIDDVAIHGGCPPRPRLTVTAQPLQTALCPGETDTLTNAICNAGSAPLVWSLKEETRTAATDSGLADVPWLSEAPSAGTIQLVGCTDIDVTFDPQTMAAGIYYADLVLDTNDPGSPKVTWPVSMTVKAEADCKSGDGKVRVYLPVVLRND